MPASLAPDVQIGLAVGDGDEIRGTPVSSSAAFAAGEGEGEGAAGGGAAGGGETRLDVMQHFRLVVHDLLTQRLTLRVLVKEVGVPLAELANETISLADLRAGAPAVRAVQLSLATRAGRPAPPPAVVHLNLTYNLLATEDPHDDGCSYEPSNSSVCS